MVLRGEVAAAQQAAQRAKSDAETAALRAVDARLKAQGVDGERDVTALNRRLDGLATSLTELNARLDELSARVEALGRQVRGGGGATTTGSAPSGAGTPSAGSAPSGASAPPRAATATPAPPPVGQRPATNALQPQDIYQAMAGFREFLRRFPDHPLAGNAQYWIGEGFVSQARAATNAGQAERAGQELESAVQEFRKVLANYPRSEKAPTSLYKEALALIDLKQPAVAQQRLEYLVANFPQSEETPLARERLNSLKAPR